MRRLQVMFIFFFIFVGLTCLLGQEIVEAIVAIVNDDVITLSQYKEQHEALYQMLRSRYQGDEFHQQYRALRKNLLNTMITDLLLDFANWADQIFACGPTLMYRAMATRNQQLKAKSVQVSLEVRMGCGRGVCYGCTVKTKGGLKQVCTDGPIFALDGVLWDELALE